MIRNISIEFNEFSKKNWIFLIEEKDNTVLCSSSVFDSVYVIAFTVYTFKWNNKAMT